MVVKFRESPQGEFLPVFLLEKNMSPLRKVTFTDKNSSRRPNYHIRSTECTVFIMIGVAVRI